MEAQKSLGELLFSAEAGEKLVELSVLGPRKYVKFLGWIFILPRSGMFILLPVHKRSQQICLPEAAGAYSTETGHPNRCKPVTHSRIRFRINDVELSRAD